VNRTDPHQPLVILAAAGPGEPDLVSLAVVNWIKLADTVLYDRLAPKQLLRWAAPSAELIDVGKVPGAAGPSQQRINALLIEKARPGRLVVRLKGGDPLIFGRGGEEAEALARAGIPFRIVPGITAATAAAAYAGIPLTDRRLASSVAFVTGREAPQKLESGIDYAALARIDTIVFYMSVGRCEDVAARLIAAGRDGQTPAAVVQNASLPAQRTVTATLATIARAASAVGVEPPAVLIVGDVVSMREQLAWFEKLPLFGKTVLVTRRLGDSQKLVQDLRLLGAKVIEAPAISIEPLTDFSALDAQLNSIDRYNWLVFTSRNGVNAFFERLWHLGGDARRLAQAKLAAVGPATASALRTWGVAVDLVARPYTTAALAEALIASGEPASWRILLVRSDIAPAGLAERIAEAGAEVAEVAAYRTVRPEALPDEALEALREGRVDWITFTSRSTVENFLALLPEGLDVCSARLAAIGPVTAQALLQHGLAPTVTADPHTIEALVTAIAGAP